MDITKSQLNYFFKRLSSALKIYDYNSKELRRILRKHRILSKREREFVKLYFIKYKKWKEKSRLKRIIAEMGITIVNARKIKSRSLKKIKPYIVWIPKSLRLTRNSQS